MSIANDIWKKCRPKSFEKAREEIRSGDILLASGNSTVSELIKDATGSTFSHVGVIVKMPVSDQWLVMESVETIGVRCVTLKNGYLENYGDTGKPYDGRLMVARCEEMAAKEKHLPKLYQRAFSLLGYHYNESDIFDIGARIVASKIGIHANGKLHPGKQYICSEYVYACFNAIGIKFPFDKDGFIAPSDIASAPNVNAVCQLKAIK